MVKKGKGSRKGQRQGPPPSPIVVDVVGNLLDRLLNVRRNARSKSVRISIAEVRELCRGAERAFLAEPSLLEIPAPIKVCGDIHGQYFDLLHLFDVGGTPGRTRYLFLGDYVDRGKNSLEVICLFFALKIKHPNSFYMIRGNHETAAVNRTYGFYDEIRRRFNQRDFSIVYDRINDAFDYIPLAAVIEGKIFCCHGGLSPHLKSLRQIRNLTRPRAVRSGWMTDVVWSDPAEDIDGWEKQNNPRNPRHRGLGYLFGQDVLEDFLYNNNLEMVCRAHECVAGGYEWMFDRQLVTVFSAPNYSQRNSGAIMKVFKVRRVGFQVFQRI